MMNPAQKNRILFLVVLGCLLFLFFSGQNNEPSTEPRLKINPLTVKKAAAALHVAANELDRLADEGATNTDDYLVRRAQEAFDAHIKDVDLPGPDILSRRAARLAVKPAVTAIIRAVTTEQTETDNEF
ncbi:MAG: hypothetical protein LBT46_04860 [Planctomycetaceae bacterium]|jgi:hypothetical protein|nr:hypothetical protein [Planctomycetaceae bacterium]